MEPVTTSHTDQDMAAQFQRTFIRVRRCGRPREALAVAGRVEPDEIALRAAAPAGFALGGGNALMAHGVVDRMTEDVDLFTDREDGVAQVADAVQSALLASGLDADRQDKTGGCAGSSLSGRGASAVRQRARRGRLR
jgi:hypothetical protein